MLLLSKYYYEMDASLQISSWRSIGSTQLRHQQLPPQQPESCMCLLGTRWPPASSSWPPPPRAAYETPRSPLFNQQAVAAGHLLRAHSNQCSNAFESKQQERVAATPTAGWSLRAPCASPSTAAAFAEATSAGQLLAGPQPASRFGPSGLEPAGFAGAAESCWFAPTLQQPTPPLPPFELPKPLAVPAADVRLGLQLGPAFSTSGLRLPFQHL